MFVCCVKECVCVLGFVLRVVVVVMEIYVGRSASKFFKLRLYIKSKASPLSVSRECKNQQNGFCCCL